MFFRLARRLVLPALFCVLAGLGLASCTPAPPPLRVELWGDSASAQLQGYFNYFIGGSGKATGRVHAYGGTALCDWFPDMRAETDPARRSAFHPQVAVIQFSGDAFTPCMHDTTGRAYSGQALVDKYARDSAYAIGLFSRLHIPVYFVSTPISRADAALGYVGMTPLGKMFSALPARYPVGGYARFIDGAAAVEWHGHYTDTLPCFFFEKCTGRWPDGTPTVVVREWDGTHYCPVHEYLQNGQWVCPVYMPGGFRFITTITGRILLDYHLS